VYKLPVNLFPLINHIRDRVEMVHEKIKQWTQNAPVILDGAWATQLQAQGLAIGDCPDEWNIKFSHRVEEIARKYVEAGSQVILTNTFGGNCFTLAKYGLENKVNEINRAGVEISKRAAEDHALVFASIGPTGKTLMMDDTSEDEIKDAFTAQAQALAESGADAIVIETMSDPPEAKLAIKAAKSTNLPVVACMVFDSGKHKDRTMMGTIPEQAAEELSSAGADVIGANCGQGIEGFVSICRRLHAATDKPIWIKANAGLPELENGKAVYKTAPQEFAGYIPQLLEAGASFVGGCCGTTPDFIRAVVQEVASPSCGSN